jgi:hypothetical protein
MDPLFLKAEQNQRRSRAEVVGKPRIEPSPDEHRRLVEWHNAAVGGRAALAPPQHL